MRLADLQQKAARLQGRLDPEGVKARGEERKRDRRVELRREDSGAASLAGRELDPAEALAGKASIDAEAVRLRKAGLPGTLGLGNPEASPIVTECHIACTLCRR
jgi:hypothetical protein